MIEINLESFKNECICKPTCIKIQNYLTHTLSEAYNNGLHPFGIFTVNTFVDVPKNKIAIQIEPKELQDQIKIII